MTKYLLDTNVLVRFILGDHNTLSPAARKLFGEACDGKCALILTEVAVAEAVWVLHSFYNIKRNPITEWLSKVILSAGVRCMKRDEMLDALNRFASTKCDFLDCYLASLAAASGDHVATFDKDFEQFDDVRRWEPEA